MREHLRFVEIDQDEFAATADADNARASKLSIERSLRRRRDEFWQQNLAGHNSASNQDATQRAHHLFDFRQLRHERESEGSRGRKSKARSLLYGCCFHEGGCRGLGSSTCR